MANLLRELRKEKGWTQEQICSLLKIGQKTYSSYETKSVMLPVKLAKKLGKIYGIEWPRFYEEV